MAINFTNATGNLFNVLGKCGLLIKQLASYLSAQKTNMVGTSELNAQLATQPDIQAIVGSTYLSQLNQSESISSLATQIAIQYINRVVFNDNPQPNQSITSLNTLASILEVIRQMKAETANVLAQTITATPALFTSNVSNTSNAVLNLSTQRPLDGKVLENAFAETLTVLCTQDSYLGGATARNEQYTITGQGAQGDVFAYNWPQGSNCSVNFNAIDAQSNNSNGNLLNNSAWTTWSGGTPSNWTFNTGSGLVSQENAITFDGPSAIKVTGDGSTLLSFQQQFGAGTTGTAGTLTNLNQYGVNLWLRRGGAGITGQLNIDLVDQNGTVVLDAGANSNTITINLSGLNTNYVSYLGAFRTPLINPSQYWIRLRMPTGQALNNGGLLYIAGLSMGLMSQLYTHGPWGCIHSGGNSAVQGDWTTAVITNSRGAAGTLSTFQTLLYQLFSDMQTNELLLPSSASPSISDGLIAA